MVMLHCSNSYSQTLPIHLFFGTQAPLQLPHFMFGFWTPAFVQQKTWSKRRTYDLKGFWEGLSGLYIKLLESLVKSLEYGIFCPS